MCPEVWISLCVILIGLLIINDQIKRTFKILEEKISEMSIKFNNGNIITDSVNSTPLYSPPVYNLNQNLI